MALDLKLNSNAAAIISSLGAFPSRMAQKVAAAMDLENQLSIGHAQANYLTGPRPLKLGVRTNRLRNSLNASKAKVSGNSITSTIGTNVAYAGVHERGFDGNVTVRSHQRKKFTTHTTTSGGVFDMKTGKVTRRAKKKISLYAGDITVKAHSRHMVVRKRAYLAPTLADRQKNYGDAISAAILTAWQEGGA